jgi:hypothetical protein
VKGSIFVIPKKRVSKTLVGLGVGFSVAFFGLIGVSSVANAETLPTRDFSFAPVLAAGWWCSFVPCAPVEPPPEPPYTGPCKSKEAEPCVTERGDKVEREWYYDRSSYWNGQHSYRNRPEVKLKGSGLDDVIVRTYLNGPITDGGQGLPGQKPLEIVWNGIGSGYPGLPHLDACKTTTKTTIGIGTTEIGTIPLVKFFETANFAYGINYSVKDDYWKQDWQRWVKYEWTGGSRIDRTNYSIDRFVKRTVTYQPPNESGCLFHADPYVVSKQCTVSLGPISVDGPYGFGVNPEYNGVNRSSIVEGSVASVQTYKNPGGSTWKENTTFGKLYKQYNNGQSLDDANQSVLINLLRTGCEESVSIPASVRSSVQMYGGGQFKIKKTEDYAVCNYWVYPGYNQYEFIDCSGINTQNRWDYGERVCSGPFQRYSPNTLGRFNSAKYDGSGKQKVFSLSACGTTQCTWTPPGTPTPADPKRTLQGHEDHPFNNNQRLFTVPADGRAVNIEAPRLTMSVRDNGVTLVSTPTKWTIWEVQPENEPWDTKKDPNRQKPNLNSQPFEGSVGSNGSLGRDKLWVNQKESNGDSKVMSQAGVPSTSGWHDTGANIMALRFYRPADKNAAAAGTHFKIQAHFHQLFRQNVRFDAVSSVGRQTIGTTNIRTQVENIPKTCSIPQQTFHVVAGRNSGGTLTTR